MRRHGPVIAHCTDSEDFPTVHRITLLHSANRSCVRNRRTTDDLLVTYRHTDALSETFDNNNNSVFKKTAKKSNRIRSGQAELP